MTGTQERLLVAAASAFASRGYHATALQDVADAVGIQKSTIYKHFRSKEHLLVACLTRGHLLREEVLDQVAALDSAPVDLLHEYLRRYTLAMLANRDLSAVFAREWVHLSASARVTDLDRRRLRRHVLADLISGAASAGVDAQMVATYLRGAVHSVLDWYRVDGPVPQGDVAEIVADLGCVLVAGAAPPPAPVRSHERRTGRAIGARAPRSRRDAIDDAALRVVRAKGFAATTMQDVAAEAGLLKGSIYHYVASKDELLMRIFEAAHLELTTIVGTVAQLDASPADQLCELVRLQVAWFLDGLDQAVVLFREWPFLVGENRELVAGRRKGLERFAGRLLDQAHTASGVEVRDSTGITVRFALGAVYTVSDWYRVGGAWSPPEVAACYAELTRAFLHRPVGVTGALGR